VENSDTATPGYSCPNDNADVENIVRVTKVVKNARKLSLGPLLGVQDGSEDVSYASHKKVLARKISHKVVRLEEVGVQKSRQTRHSCQNEAYR